MPRVHRVRAAIAALSIAAAGLAAAPALADKRVALVVGNSAYVNIPRLTNPANDARLMADTLRSLGFTLIGGGAQLDLDKARFDSAVQTFGNQLQGADVALFYYAGHGVQVRGANYLVPVGANPTREADVDFQLLDTNLVLRQMEGSGAKLNLVILDACRNNPFGGRGLRAVDSGLAQMRAPEGTLISFATQPGNVAQDGADGNSPYTKALTQTIRRPGLDIFQTFNQVGLAVMQATGDSQQPWVSSSPIRGSFYFSGSPSTPAPAVSTPGQAPDEIAWNFLKNTTDLAALRQYLAEFGTSPHRREAEARIAALERDARDRAAPDAPRQPKPLGRDETAKRIDDMVGLPPPPPPFSAPVTAPAPVAPRAASPPSDDIAKRIDGMVGLPPSMDTTPNFAPPSAILNKKVKRDVSLGYLNLRTGPGQNYQVVARIPAGASGVAVTGACATSKDGLSAFPFCQVQWNGHQGWVSSNGLE